MMRWRSAVQTGAPKPPAFYDFEASSVGGLPIEIGWAFADPASDEITSESHLIIPPPSWNLNHVWDLNAEKLHKISRDQLYAHGRPPAEIAHRMNKVLAGRRLYSDHPRDERWWLMMWQAGAVPTITSVDAETICVSAPAFELRRADAESLLARLARRRGFDAAAFETVKAEAACIAPRIHRAEADARHLAVLWLMISRGSSSR